MYKRHLVIAPYLLENPDILEFYRLLITKGADVILDNGVYETGKPMDLDDYFKVIRKLKPTQVVAPDVWGDWQNTVLRVDEFFGRVEKERLETKFEMMGVPHGNNIEEWMKCYYDIIPMCDVIGLSVGEWDDKLSIIRPFFAMNLDSRFDHVPIHLLGLWNADELQSYITSVDDAGNVVKHPRIRSVDTSMPFKLAMRNKSIGTRFIPSDVKSDFTKMDFKAEWTEEQQKIAISNVETLKKWVEGKDE